MNILGGYFSQDVFFCLFLWDDPILKVFYKCVCASHAFSSPASSTEAVRGIKLGK